MPKIQTEISTYFTYFEPYLYTELLGAALK